MSVQQINTLDYSPPDKERQAFDLPIVFAAGLNSWVALLVPSHSDTRWIPGVFGCGAVALFLAGAFHLPTRRWIYPLASALGLIEIGLLIYSDRYSRVDGVTADGFVLFLLNPAIVVWSWRLFRADRSMLFLAIAQLALVPLVVNRFPAFPGWVRFGPNSARWVYGLAWIACCGNIVGCMAGIAQSFRLPRRNHPWIAGTLLLSPIALFLARLWLDQILRRSGVWITPPWDDSYPTPDPDPLSYRAYFLAAVSPLTLLILFRMVSAVKNHHRHRLL